MKFTVFRMILVGVIIHACYIFAIVVPNQISEYSKKLNAQKVANRTLKQATEDRAELYNQISEKWNNTYGYTGSFDRVSLAKRIPIKQDTDEAPAINSASRLTSNAGEPIGLTRYCFGSRNTGYQFTRNSAKGIISALYSIEKSMTTDFSALTLSVRDHHIAVNIYDVCSLFSENGDA